MGEDIATKKCVPCEGNEEPFTKEVAVEWTARLGNTWKLSEDATRIERSFTFKNFKEAIAFVNKVAALAEGEGHHPDIHIHYSKVRLELWTHAIGGLFDNDFIMAAKIDRIRNTKI